MINFGVDSVKAEKALAMRRYKRQRRLSLCFRVAAALVLLGWFVVWSPAVLDVATNHIAFLSDQFRAFVLVNVIIFVVYFLSVSNSSGSRHKSDGALQSHDLYDQYVSLSNSSYSQKTLSGGDRQAVVSPAPTTAEDVVHDKQIVRCERVRSPPAREHSVRDLTVMTGEEFAKEEKRYRRTRSERQMRERRSCGRALRRSETENGRELVVGGGDSPARKSTEELNNEEFRLTIESFIATQKKALMDENTALLSEERRQYMSITYM